VPVRVTIDPSAPDDIALAVISAALARGDIIGYPTDTFYGLGVDPRNARALERIFEAKGRAAGEALPLIAYSIDVIERWLGPLNARAALLADRFWPGPLTLLLPRPSGVFPDALTSGKPTVAVRVPAHPVARLMASAAGGLITSTSANHSGTTPASTADAVVDALGNALAVIVDSGPTPGGAPSTIVDVTDDAPRLVRAGSVPWERVLESLQ
jgi:L-threonylcarbamoyladenylate synthase